MKILKNESGIIFLTVLVISLIMMTYTIGVLSLNTSQVTFEERQIERIQAEQFAKGVFWRNVSGVPTSTTVTNSIDGKDFIVTTLQDPSGPSINDADSYTVSVDY